MWLHLVRDYRRQSRVAYGCRAEQQRFGWGDTRPAQLGNLKVLEGSSGGVCASACLTENLVYT